MGSVNLSPETCSMLLDNCILSKTNELIKNSPKGFFIGCVGLKSILFISFQVELLTVLF